MVRLLLPLTILLLVTAGVWSEDSPSAPVFNEKFTTALMKKLSADGNVIFSPMSLDSAMGLLAYGARDNTANEVFQVLGYPIDQGKHLIAEKQKLINKEQTPGAIWQTANNIMVDYNYTLREEYLSDINQNFPGVSYKSFDFTNLLNITKEVNQWVSDKTNNVITELLKPNDLDAKTKLIVLNAVYFKGEWKKAFDKNDTKKECFYSEPDKCTLTDMMHITQTYKFQYHTDLQAQIIEFPYKNENFSMIVVLPDKTKSNLTSLMNNLDVDEIITFMDRKKSKRLSNVEVTFPKFVMEYSSRFKDHLNEMGIVQIFNQAADITRMTAGRLYVDDVIHKAKITCDEEGTVAAASTAIPFLGRSLFVEPVNIKFIANRPFFYLLRDKQAGVLFAGQKVSVSNEEESEV